MRNDEPCINCGSTKFKDGRNNLYYCSKKCYLEYMFGDEAHRKSWLIQTPSKRLSQKTIQGERQA